MMSIGFDASSSGSQIPSLFEGNTILRQEVKSRGFLSFCRIIQGPDVNPNFSKLKAIEMIISSLNGRQAVVNKP